MDRERPVLFESLLETLAELNVLLTSQAHS